MIAMARLTDRDNPCRAYEGAQSAEVIGVPTELDSDQRQSTTQCPLLESIAAGLRAQVSAP